jgi:transcription termination factor NusB
MTVFACERQDAGKCQAQLDALLHLFASKDAVVYRVFVSMNLRHLLPVLRVVADEKPNASSGLSGLLKKKSFSRLRYVNRLAVLRAGAIPMPISTALREVPLKILSYCSIFNRVL